MPRGLGLATAALLERCFENSVIAVRCLKVLGEGVIAISQQAEVFNYLGGPKHPKFSPDLAG